VCLDQLTVIHLQSIGGDHPQKKATFDLALASAVPISDRVTYIVHVPTRRAKENCGRATEEASQLSALYSRVTHT
jgi:hypothetical protein